nr:NADP-specific glutamate dehydrogenase [Tanacetum cinerariifolium]
MDELYRYISPDKDLPSEEMGVGTRKMGFLYGQYRRLAGHSQGSFTGPRLNWSGSSLRTEATGYGLVFFAQLILGDMNKELKGLRCANERCDVAFPCASQNEIDHTDAINLVNSGCRILVEGSNMPCAPEAMDVLKGANVLIAPSIAAGNGGVIVGELELKEYSLNWAQEDLRMNEQIARDAEVARIHAEEEIQAMIDSLDKSNETVAKYLEEYQQFASDVSLEKKMELISG